MGLDETASLRRQGMDSSSRSRIVCKIFVSQDLDSQTKNLVHTHKRVDALFLESIQMHSLGGTKKREGRTRLEKSLACWVIALYGLSHFFCFL